MPDRKATLPATSTTITSQSDPLHIKQERIEQLHRRHGGRTALLVIDMQCGFLEPGAGLRSITQGGLAAGNPS
jgi:hypothetical protein